MTNKYGYYLHQWDKSLLDKTRRKIKGLLRVKEGEEEFTGRIVPVIRKNGDTGEFIKQNVKVYARKLGGSAVGKLICQRIKKKKNHRVWNKCCFPLFAFLQWLN